MAIVLRWPILSLYYGSDYILTTSLLHLGSGNLGQLPYTPLPSVVEPCQDEHRIAASEAEELWGHRHAEAASGVGLLC